MAKSANLYARIEPEVKEQAEAILSALGIPASNAITMFYKQVILQRGLPFEVKLPEHPLDISRMTAEQLAGILDRKPSGEGTSNIGVRNVNERLRLYFGDDCGPKFFSEPGKGTLVMLVLPRTLEERGEEEAHGGEG